MQQYPMLVIWGHMYIKYSKQVDFAIHWNSTSQCPSTLELAEKAWQSQPLLLEEQFNVQAVQLYVIICYT